MSLPGVIAQRNGVRGGFRIVTHAMVCLWSAEVLHAIRMRPESFRSLRTHSGDVLQTWWSGRLPDAGTASCVVLLDPFATGRQRAMTDLEHAIASARPRVRGYSDAAALIKARGGRSPT